MYPRPRLERAANDPRYLSLYRRACERYDSYMQTVDMQAADKLIAYFSMEYGLTECLPIYSGGLGLLSGDHLKASSDADYPLIAVGLALPEGLPSAVAESGRLAAGTLSDQRFLHAAR